MPTILTTMILILLFGASVILPWSGSGSMGTQQRSSTWDRGPSGQEAAQNCWRCFWIECYRPARKALWYSTPPPCGSRTGTRITHSILRTWALASMVSCQCYNTRNIRTRRPKTGRNATLLSNCCSFRKTTARTTRDSRLASPVPKAWRPCLITMIRTAPL